MKLIIKKGIEKVLIVFITIIMISNFIMPNRVQASVLTAAGNKLISGFFQLMTYIGDVGMATMQRMMKGTWDLKEHGKYAIKYSPGLIFANEVAALDINFISATEGDKEEITRYAVDVNNNDDMNQLLKEVNQKVKNGSIAKIREVSNQELEAGDTYEQYGAAFTAGHYTKYYPVSEGFSNDGSAGYYKYSLRNVFGWTNLADKEVSELTGGKGEGNTYLYFYVSTADAKLIQWEVKRVDKNKGDYTVSIYTYDLRSITKQEVTTITSVAYTLKPTIAKWYVALRTVALVGLLSALVYIGIRIILNSGSAQNQAKYKNMLKDWIVAMCILFTLHYLMAFMLDITNTVNKILVTNVIETTTSKSDLPDNNNKIDTLVSKIRQDIEDDTSFETMENALPKASNTIMYLAIVILTGTFTFQYLKRVVYMAFLTLVSPLVALTYPLDKIKDSKAQAFSYLIREYIFNCLIQPVHLLLYTIFIGMAANFARENILYTIVVLAFLVPAEKIIKEMFGLKSQSPTGAFNTAAGGAFVMSMLNKMKAKPPKDGKGGAGGSSGGVRTASSGSGSSGGSSSSSGSGGSKGASSSSSSSGAGTSSGSSSSGGAGSPGGASGSSGGSGRNTRNKQKNQKHIRSK